MTLKDQINADFLEAYKARNIDKKNFLGVLKGEIQTAEGKPDYDGENTAKAIVKKMDKSLKEILAKGGKGAAAEIEYLKPYLPELMSKEKITEVISALVSDGANNIGMIMRGFNTNHGGQADNRVVKEVALEILKV